MGGCGGGGIGELTRRVAKTFRQMAMSVLAKNGGRVGQDRGPVIKDETGRLFSRSLKEDERHKQRNHPEDAVE